MHSKFQLLAVFSYSCLNLYNSPYANVRFLPVSTTSCQLSTIIIGTEGTERQIDCINVSSGNWASEASPTLDGKFSSMFMYNLYILGQSGGGKLFSISQNIHTF